MEAYKDCYTCSNSLLCLAFGKILQTYKCLECKDKYAFRFKDDYSPLNSITSNTGCLLCLPAIWVCASCLDKQLKSYIKYKVKRNLKWELKNQKS